MSLNIRLLIATAYNKWLSVAYDYATRRDLSPKEAKWFWNHIGLPLLLTLGDQQYFYAVMACFCVAEAMDIADRGRAVKDELDNVELYQCEQLMSAAEMFKAKAICCGFEEPDDFLNPEVLQVWARQHGLTLAYDAHMAKMKQGTEE